MDPGTEAIGPKTIKMTLVEPLMTNVKAVRADCAVSAWSRPGPTLSIEGLTPCLSGGEGVGGEGKGPLSRCWPPSPL